MEISFVHITSVSNIVYNNINNEPLIKVSHYGLGKQVQIYLYIICSGVTCYFVHYICFSACYVAFTAHICNHRILNDCLQYDTNV